MGWEITTPPVHICVISSFHHASGGSVPSERARHLQHSELGGRGNHGIAPKAGTPGDEPLATVLPSASAGGRTPRNEGRCNVPSTNHPTDAKATDGWPAARAGAKPSTRLGWRHREAQMPGNNPTATYYPRPPR